MSKIDELKFDDKNFNKHTEFGMSLIEKSLKENGAGRSILLDKDNNIIAGNGVVEAAGQAGFEKVKIVETDGTEIIAVKRTDVRLNSKKGRQMALADNATAKADIEWDYEAMAEEFDDEYLSKWGVDLPILPVDEIIDTASLGTIKEYNEDTSYNLDNLYREKVSSTIINDIKKAEDNGKLHPQIADILKTRASQCSVFNFDEIIKFYRSGDATEYEKDLLRRLYLVYITPKETIENAMLEFEKLTGEIYDRKLMEKQVEEYAED